MSTMDNVFSAMTAVGLLVLAPRDALALPWVDEVPIVVVSGLVSISAIVPVPAGSYDELLVPPVIGPLSSANEYPPNRPMIEFIGHNVTSGDVTSFEVYTWLRAWHCGRSGWYNRANGVTSPDVFTGGRLLGYPKYMLDPDSSVSQTPDGWVSLAKLDGEPFVTMTWRQDDEEVERLLREQPWQREWLQGHGRRYFGPVWDTFPEPNQPGGAITWSDVDEDSTFPPNWESHVGVVTITIRQGVDPSRTEGDWMSLVPESVEVPGILEHFDEGYSYLVQSTPPIECPETPEPEPGSGDDSTRRTGSGFFGAGSMQGGTLLLLTLTALLIFCRRKRRE